MSDANIQERPPITVTSLDLERLERLLESPVHEDNAVAQELQEELNRARVVEPRAVPPEVITMHSTTRFVDEVTGAEHELTLVYPHEADGTPGQVSVLAPVGSALLGLSAGQRIDWPLAGGRSTRLRVLAVVRQPESLGEYHR
ncbi:nucleoside diphosphate kinase regulator [Thioalbus denitrificans]|uniref:Regulator of nucleoside diphosphate kinase n=1 Tax=Thioalbus denitrificans TaxID=547122 RepID=A0A369CHN0_9GAMM|nr:nucleoside diphosphate kinase regulator [Thioalbus denitrificans]RCX33193.1 regulator of nucleoside diphosphate kinase [Thioalbus denitrificans]